MRKICNKCNIEKRIPFDFQRKPRMKSGFDGTCKKCRGQRANLLARQRSGSKGVQRSPMVELS